MWERRWVRYHAIAAPFGILAATALLPYLTGPSPRNGLESLRQAATLVDFAVPIYAAVAVLLERGGVLVFWALEQRKKWRDERLAVQAAREAALRAKVRDEVIAEVRSEVIAEVRNEVIAEVRDEVIAEVCSEVIAEMRSELEQKYEFWAEQLARDKGLSPDDLPPLPR